MKDFFVRRFHALKTTERHWLRRVVGGVFVIGGLLGFLPVLGYWMLPLGLALLAVDFPVARRANRLLQVWWGRLWQRLRGATPGETKRTAMSGPKTPDKDKRR